MKAIAFPLLFSVATLAHPTGLVSTSSDCWNREINKTSVVGHRFLLSQP